MSALSVDSKTRRARKLRALAVPLSASAFLLGLILQPVFGQLLDKQLKQPDKLLVATSILVVVTMLATANAVLLAQRRTSAQMDALVGRFKTIDERLGLRVEFLPRGAAGAEGDPYAIVMRLVAEAETEILVLDHRPTRDADRFGNNSTLVDASRCEYYKVFSTRATRLLQTGQYLRYRRVVQLDEGPTATWNSAANGDTIFADHVQSLISARSNSAQLPSAIKTSVVFFPNASIVIVDGRTVLLELAVAGPDGNARVQGDLVFHDPDGVLAGPLRQLFEYIDAESTLLTNVV